MGEPKRKKKKVRVGGTFDVPIIIDSFTIPRIVNAT